MALAEIHVLQSQDSRQSINANIRLFIKMFSSEVLSPLWRGIDLKEVAITKLNIVIKGRGSF